MDYGDGRYQGIYQFNEKYRRSEMCGKIDSVVDNNQCINSGEVTGELATSFDWLPDLAISDCSVVGSSCLSGLGECVDGECVVLDLKLVATDNATNTTYRFEFDLGEFSLPVSPGGERYEAVFALADPIDGCVGSLSDLLQYTGKIIIMREGGSCTFYSKAQVAEEAGGMALVVVSADGLMVMDSPALPYTAVGIPSLLVTKSSGDALISLVEASPVGVDGIIGYVPVGDVTAFPAVVDDEGYDYLPFVIGGVIVALVAVAAILLFFRA